MNDQLPETRRAPEFLGLYGGTFDPIHVGHLIVARAVAEAVGLTGVVLIPTKQPPHKDVNDLTDASLRIEMIQLAIKDEPLFSFSDVDMTHEGPTYTIDTIARFRKQLSHDTDICWIIGADSLNELATWHRVAELVDDCRIVTAKRPGSDRIRWDGLKSALREDQLAQLNADIVATPLIDISATCIRRRVGEGRSIRYLVPDAVCEFIRRRQLYRTEGDQVVAR